MPLIDVEIAELLDCSSCGRQFPGLTSHQTIHVVNRGVGSIDHGSDLRQHNAPQHVLSKSHRIQGKQALEYVLDADQAGGHIASRAICGLQTTNSSHRKRTDSGVVQQGTHVQLAKVDGAVCCGDSIRRQVFIANLPNVGTQLLRLSHDFSRRAINQHIVEALAKTRKTLQKVANCCHQHMQTRHHSHFIRRNNGFYGMHISHSVTVVQHNGLHSSDLARRLLLVIANDHFDTQIASSTQQF